MSSDTPTPTLGRPRELHDLTRLVIQLERPDREKLHAVAKARGITAAQLVREWIARLKI